MKCELLDFDSTYERREWVSITELCTLKRCPRAFFYKVGVGLRRRGAIALDFGTAIHCAIPSAIAGNLLEAARLFDESWNIHPQYELMNDPKNNRALAYDMLKNVALTFSTASKPFELLVPPLTYEVQDIHSKYEVPFAIDVGGEMLLVGRSDGLCRVSATSTHWACEYKTTSEEGERFASAFEMNPQVLGYTLAQRMLFPQLDIQGCIVMSLLKSAAKVRRTSTIAHPIFVRQHHIDAFVEWARWRMVEIRQFEKMKNFPMDIAGCNSIATYGLPLYNCEYMSLCQPSDWRANRELYDVERHVPFVGLTVKGKDVL